MHKVVDYINIFNTAVMSTSNIKQSTELDLSIFSELNDWIQQESASV